MIDPRSTPTRTFLVWPVLVLVGSRLARRPLDWRFAPVAAGGYMLYRTAGTYRTRHGGGGPGMAQPAERLVTTGPYAMSRNPMYLGHLLTFAAFVGATRSRWSAAVFGWHLRWFDDRAATDERQLRERFGEDYEHYRAAVPRWLPWRGGQLRRLLRPPSGTAGADA
ncbi:isoprenylcysteine carboxylmethyltransferase family protein [Egicoccus sp. AB-alg2]|uniref:methyltransferase family protein n=1 Tax=Egicoccus sp. AB-alg2 TaxID=3242693 RepID=UPI00359E0474